MFLNFSKKKKRTRIGTNECTKNSYIFIRDDDGGVYFCLKKKRKIIERKHKQIKANIYTMI